ncbi:MAG: hypothetical protein QOC90_2699 [Mycobacterium sp.]|nr:hypothetical protein [Mycobacterium sp.]
MTTKTTAKSTAVSSSNRDLTEITFLTRALKAPTMREAVARLAERARAEFWTPRKSLEEFDFDHASLPAVGLPCGDLALQTGNQELFMAETTARNSHVPVR